MSRRRASAIPNAIAPRAPALTRTTPDRATLRRRAISLGRSRLSAEIWTTPATVAPATSRNAETRCRNRRAFVMAAAYGANRRSYNRTDGRARAPPPAPDGDDRRRQFDARPRGGARARGPEGRRRARGRRVLRLPLRRARGRARPAGDAWDRGRRHDAAPEDAVRRGNHRQRGCGAA